MTRQQRRSAEREQQKLDDQAERGAPVVAHILPDTDVAADVAEALAYLTPAERARYHAIAREERAVQRGELKRPLTIFEFVDRVSGGRFKWYTYARVLAGVLQRVADGTLSRVMVFAPPRHGKSELVSRLFPAYYLYRHTDRWAGLVSFGAELANTLSRAARGNYYHARGERERGSVK